MIVRRRVARTSRTCNTCDQLAIAKGDQYLVSTYFPSDDFVTVNHPFRMDQCRGCAEGRGRGGEFPPAVESVPLFDLVAVP